MIMTLIVLALDALDAGLVEEWELDNLKLNNHKQIETFDYSRDKPYTLEVWPSVATGVHPKEHGIGGKEHSGWSTSLNPLFSFASKFLSLRARSKIGDILESIGFKQEYNVPEKDLDTFMDGEGRTVHNWPGIYNREEIVYMWEIGKEPDYSIDKLNRLVFGKTAEHFGWAREMLNYNLELAALHNHSLDILGHSYTYSDEGIEGSETAGSENHLDELESAYIKVDRFVGELEESLGDDDEILILSDHGMKNDVLDDDEFGEHSYRAFASTTMSKELPESVLDFREWIEKNIEEVNQEDKGTVNMPTEQLRELGYID